MCRVLWWLYGALGVGCTTCSQVDRLHDMLTGGQDGGCTLMEVVSQ